MIWFLDGPASNPFIEHLYEYWGTGFTPTFITDGVALQIGWDQGILESQVNDRLAVPAVLSIGTEITGDETGGSITYSLTAEEDPGDDLKLYGTIVQSNEQAVSGWALYTGQTLFWLPKVFPCGETGTEVIFTGPYPQTVHLTRTYSLDPAQQILEDLDLVSFVVSTATGECLNGSFEEMPVTGTGGQGSQGGTSLAAWPNPSCGRFRVRSSTPGNTPGTVEIFDVSGRTVTVFQSGSTETVFLHDPGIYFVRMTTDTGETITRRMTVIR